MKTPEEFLVDRFDEDGIGSPPKHVYESITKVMEEYAQAKIEQNETARFGLSLLRELSVRTQVRFPRTPQELRWFEQGVEKSGDFMIRLNDFFERQRPDNEVDNLYENLD